MSLSKYQSHLRKVADINYASAVLNWDQETYMPVNGAKFRAQQLSTLAGLSHDNFTQNSFGILLSELLNNQSLTEEDKKNVSITNTEYKRQKKYSTEFVELMSKTVSEAFQSWQKAKKENNFKLFEADLEKIVALKKQEADLLGFKEHPYDALLDLYEPGLTTADLSVLFKEVQTELLALVEKIIPKENPLPEFLYQFYDPAKQWNFSLYLLQKMGYDFSSGRQDKSPHPFTTNFSAQDVRVTTRINEYDLSEIIWSTIHEGGHALYEQGLKPENYGLPSGEYTSLGIHESQSRLWENNVGRSIGFWKVHYPVLQEEFPENLKDVSLEDFYKAMNFVKPSLVRTNADELTYHFHILIRFEIEKALIDGSIKVSELPEIWKEKHQRYLGIEVTNLSQGVLQDIHWSHGSFGYFPTYSIGSFYAAQFYHAAVKSYPEIQDAINLGNSGPLLDWLRKNIHQHGKFYSAEELCINISGEKLNFKYFMDYAKNKYFPIYQLSK